MPSRPPRADVLAASALFVWAMLEAVLAHGPGPLGARIAFAAIVTVPLVVRRRAPVAVVVVLAAATVVWARHASTPESGTLPFPSLLLARSRSRATRGNRPRPWRAG